MPDVLRRSIDVRFGAVVRYTILAEMGAKRTLRGGRPTSAPGAERTRRPGSLMSAYRGKVDSPRGGPATSAFDPSRTSRRSSLNGRSCGRKRNGRSEHIHWKADRDSV